MVVIIGRCIGNFFNIIGRVAHGHPQPGRLDHGAVVAGVTHGHRLLPAQAQMRRQRQQAAALRHTGGVDLHVAGQAGGQLHAGAGLLYRTPGGIALGLVVVEHAVLFDLVRVGAQRRVHIVYLNAGRAEVAFQVFGHHVHVVLGVFAGRVAFAADKNTQHPAIPGKDIIDLQRIGSGERLLHKLLPGLQIHHAGAVGGQRIPYTGDRGECCRDAAGRAPRGGQHRHTARHSAADRRQRAGGDLLFIVKNRTVQVQCHKADILHFLHSLYRLIVPQNRHDCKPHDIVLE